MAASLLQLAHAVTVEMRHTHGVFYPGLPKQPILQLRITGAPGETITKLEFSDGKTTTPADIQLARLSTSGTWNGYTLNADRKITEKSRAKPSFFLGNYSTLIP